ncbi:MAG: Transcription elongation factor GreA [Candidatus Moranbacteria bacterium GW2011_GWE2_36_40]|nr:MAG: Transcription elongation factor GreA [Candidatus Moranbacteria bacterium GW2011_GWE2_36_40]
MVRFITKEGLKKLNEELEDRKTRLRQEIAAEAKSQQNENESRIGELEMVIKNSQVVERDDSQKGAQMSSVVKVESNGNQMEFTIVGSNEADPANFKISNESPLGKAFMGHNAGDSVDVTTPKGVITYKIVDVK